MLYIAPLMAGWLTYREVSVVADALPDSPVSSVSRGDSATAATTAQVALERSSRFMSIQT